MTKTVVLFLLIFLNLFKNVFAQEKIIFPKHWKITYKDSLGIILIDHLCNNRREKAIEMLNKKKVDGHVHDINGNYAIQYAIQNLDTNLITILFRHGAKLEKIKKSSPSEINNLWFDRNNPTDFLVNFQDIGDGCGQIIDIPQEPKEPDTIIIDYITRKHLHEFNATQTRDYITNYYIKNAHFSMSKKFIDRKVQFLDSFRLFKSPMIAACQSGNFEIFKMYLDLGFKIDEETMDEQNSLHFACLGGEERTIQYLISKGIKLEKDNKCKIDNYWFSTPHKSFQCLLSGKLVSPEIIQYFIDQNFKLEPEDYWYYLFYHRSSAFLFQPSWKLVYQATQILLNNEISPNFRGSFVSPNYFVRFDNSLSLLGLGCIYKDNDALEIAKLLVENGANLSYFNRFNFSYPIDNFHGYCYFEFERTRRYLNFVGTYLDPWNDYLYFKTIPPFEIGHGNDLFSE